METVWKKFDMHAYKIPENGGIVAKTMLKF